jgi:hypothetical protein
MPIIKPKKAKNMNKKHNKNNNLTKEKPMKQKMIMAYLNIQSLNKKEKKMKLQVNDNINSMLENEVWNEKKTTFFHTESNLNEKPVFIEISENIEKAIQEKPLTAKEIGKQTDKLLSVYAYTMGSDKHLKNDFVKMDILNECFTKIYELTLTGYKIESIASYFKRTYKQEIARNETFSNLESTNITCFDESNLYKVNDNKGFSKTEKAIYRTRLSLVYKNLNKRKYKASKSLSAKETKRIYLKIFTLYFVKGFSNVVKLSKRLNRTRQSTEQVINNLKGILLNMHLFELHENSIAEPRKDEGFAKYPIINTGYHKKGRTKYKSLCEKPVINKEYRQVLKASYIEKGYYVLPETINYESKPYYQRLCNHKAETFKKEKVDNTPNWLCNVTKGNIEPNYKEFESLESKKDYGFHTNSHKAFQCVTYKKPFIAKPINRIEQRLLNNQIEIDKIDFETMPKALNKKSQIQKINTIKEIEPVLIYNSETDSFTVLKKAKAIIKSKYELVNFDLRTNKPYRIRIDKSQIK